MDEKTVILVVHGRQRIHPHPHGDRGEKKEEFLRQITTGLLERTVKKGRGGIDFRMKKAPKIDPLSLTPFGSASS
jgi:hypothetical protein